MQDLEKTPVKQYNVYTLDTYLILFDTNIKYETFSCEWYYGIDFYIGEGRWELIHNPLLGNRILINETMQTMQDIPFKKATFHLLPPGVEALEL